MSDKAVIVVSRRDHRRMPEFTSAFPEGWQINRCLTCGACASGCPVSGRFQMDPRKFVRMTVLGLTSDPAIRQWGRACTRCGDCTRACPMGIDIPRLVEAVCGIPL